jgi:hypothetical protein
MASPFHVAFGFELKPKILKVSEIAKAKFFLLMLEN